MYAPSFETKLKQIKKLKNILIIIGGKKVEPEFYELANYNLSVSNQPISEVSALGILLYKTKGIKTDFSNKKLEILPQTKGKLLKEHNN